MRQEAGFPPPPPPVEAVSLSPTVPTLYPPLPSLEEGKGRAKCLEVAEVYEGTLRKRGVANAS